MWAICRWRPLLRKAYGLSISNLEKWSPSHSSERFMYFHPLGQLGLVVAISVHLSVCPLPIRFFPRPFIGPQITWSVQDLQLIPPIPPSGIWSFSSESSKHNNSQTVRARELKFCEDNHPRSCVCYQQGIRGIVLLHGFPQSVTDPFS